MKTALVAALLFAAPAFAWGPTLMGGGVVTLSKGSDGVTFDPLWGPSGRVGFELGDRFNHEISLQLTRSTGNGHSQGDTVPLDVITLAGRYTFSVDIFTKDGIAGSGFTPTIGIGLALGAFRANTNADLSLAKWGPYLELHAMAGFRYTFQNGLSLKAELAVSTYGGFFALQPSAGLAWRF